MGENPWEPGKTVEFGSCDELLATLDKRHTPDLLYRGQRKFCWRLACTLSRYLYKQAQDGYGPLDTDLMDSMARDPTWERHALGTEDRIIDAFREGAADLSIPDLPDDDRLGWLELMQHHGAPTRLLDWTRSPHIGLWFAYSDHGGDGCAALWVFHTYPSEASYPGSVSRARTVPADEARSDRNIQNATAENATLSRDIAPLVVRPRLDLDRARAQSSALTYLPQVDAPNNFQHFVLQQLTTKIHLRAEWRADILSDCESRGINRDSLLLNLKRFEALDRIGRSLTHDLDPGAGCTAP